MAKNCEPATIIVQLIEELETVLSRWDTSMLKGQIIIKFGDTSGPCITYQTLAYPSSNLGSELSPKIVHHPSLTNVSNCGAEHSFQSSDDTVDSIRHLGRIVSPKYQTQDGERGKSPAFDRLNSTIISDATQLTLKEKCLFPYDPLDPVPSSHFSYSTAPAPSNLPYSSSMLQNSTLPPFENIMLEKESHSDENVLNESDSTCEQNPGKILTFPQTCSSNPNVDIFHEVTGEQSPLSNGYVAEEVIESHIASSRELELERNTVSSPVSSSTHQDCCDTEKIDGRNDYISKSTTSNATGESLPELNLSNSRTSVCFKKRIEYKNVFENVFEEESTNDESKSLFSYDEQIRAVDLQKYSHSELLKIVVNLLHSKEARQTGCSSLRLDTQVVYPQEMNTPSFEDCEDKMNIGKSPSPKLSTLQTPLLKNNSLSPAEVNEKSGDDARNIAGKETDLQSELQPNFRDTKVMQKYYNYSGHLDSDQTYSQSVSIQNVKPLKKRTRLCTSFKDLGFQSHEAERQDMHGKTNASIQQSPPTINKDSANKKERESIKQKTLKKRSFTCKICKNIFTTRHSYRQHLRSHDGSFKCNVCGKILKTKDSLYHHQRGLHSKEKPYHCKDCGISFNFYHSYKLHLQKHRGERPHKCQYCGKGYLTLYHLKEHIQGVHSNAYIVCHICGKKFSYNSALRLHLLRHSGVLPHKCSLCPKRFFSKYALKIHSVSHIKERNFQCETCGKCFKSECSRNFHSKNHKNQLKAHMCDVCGKTFTFKSFLDSHVQVHSKICPHICNTCGKTFKSKASLYSHNINVHKEGPKFPCSICGKSYKTKSSLASHVKQHQNENVYTCSTCNAIFPNKGGLTKHVKTIHLPHKCFICKICGKTGTRGDNMRSHVKSHKKEMSSSNNPRDFIIEETATDRFSDFQSHFVKMRQRSSELNHRSGRKILPTVQASDPNRRIQSGPITPRNVKKKDKKPTSASSSMSLLPALSQGPMTRLDNEFQTRDSSGMLSRMSKEYNGSFLSSDDNKSTTAQFLSYFCQPDIATNSINTSNQSLAFPSGSLTSLLSTINGTPESETPSPYSFIISPHLYNYQTAVGNAQPSEYIVSRPGESLDISAFGINQEQTITTLQNVSLRIPPPVEESQLSSTVHIVQEGI